LAIAKQRLTQLAELKRQIPLDALAGRAAGTAFTLPDAHIGQQQVLSSVARYLVLNCGRRWRKSTTLMIKLIRSAESQPNHLYWWVWPTGPLGQTGWDMLRKTVGGQAEISESRRRVRLTNQSEIWVKSADHEDGLRSAGLNGVAFDECRDIAARVWPEIIRPALIDRNGWAAFGSTPRGFDWFYQLFQNGLDSLATDWQSFHFTTFDNPSIASKEIEEARRNMSEAQFKQEIMAEFIENAGAVFRGVRDCATAAIQQSTDPHGEIVIGCDWAKFNDFSVFVAIDISTRRVVDMQRMNQVDYALQVERLRSFVGKWGAQQVIAESNAMGEPIIEQLQRAGLPVVGFATTGGLTGSKKPLIESLALAIERHEIAYPPISELIAELEAYEVNVNPVTHMTAYSAPSGGHDDCVMALALAWRLAASNSSIDSWLAFEQQAPDEFDPAAPGNLQQAAQLAGLAVAPSLYGREQRLG